MEIIYKGEKPELNVPYFGQQARYFKFFKECLTPYLNKFGIYAETNSGSNANGYEFTKLGYKVIFNDKSEYSNAICQAVLSDNTCDEGKCQYQWLTQYKSNYIDRAAVFAANMDLYGYNAALPESPTPLLENKIKKYRNYFLSIKNKNIKAYKIFNMDLFSYLNELYNKKIFCDVMFMDFAWPWRDGQATEEYNTTANKLKSIFTQSQQTIQIWDKNTVLDNVLNALNKAKKVSRFIALSNQSSNFPTPEILEVFLLTNGFNYERHTMLTEATNEDNLLKANFFREYLYIIKGDII